MEDQETQVLSRFRESCAGFPNGTIERAAPPAPDFIIANGARRIGVEITQSFWDVRDQGSHSKEKQARWDTALLAAQKEWQRREHRPVTVDVMWNALHHNPPAREPAVRNLACRLVDALTQLRPTGAGPKLVSRRDPDGVLLPAEVLNLVIDPEAGEWTTGWVGSIPRLQGQHVQAAVDRKEPKLPSYRKHCDEVWLLIWIDWSVPGSSYVSPPRIEPSDFRLATAFDRVFFLDGGTVFEFGVDRSLLVG